MMRLPFLFPWPRLILVMRALIETPWEVALWPTAGAALREAVRTHRDLMREGWFN